MNKTLLIVAAVLGVLYLTRKQQTAVIASNSAAVSTGNGQSSVNAATAAATSSIIGSAADTVNSWLSGLSN